MGRNEWIQANKKKLDEFFGYKDASIHWRANEAKIEPEIAVNFTYSLGCSQTINVTEIGLTNKKADSSSRRS